MNAEGRAAFLPGRRQLLGLRPTLLQGRLHQMASYSTPDAPMEICWLGDPLDVPLRSDSRVLWPGCLLGIINQVVYRLPFLCKYINLSWVVQEAPVRFALLDAAGNPGG